MKLIILVIAIAVILVFYIIYLYNSLILRKNEVERATGSVDVMLKKRFDLIPNLVEIVKTYMNYEQHLLKEITELRTRVTEAGISDKDKINIENQLTKKLGNLLVAVENYPDLKANQNFLQLQATWTEMEEQLSAARRAYNAAVISYNNAVEMFPSNMMAKSMSYVVKPMYEIEASAKEPVKASELFNKNS
jgi:LemA protein